VGFYFLYVREVEMTCAEYPCFVVQIVFLVQFPKASGLGDLVGACEWTRKWLDHFSSVLNIDVLIPPVDELIEASPQSTTLFGR
jgi:hypothetical protein